jgi:diadenosine tetraphosphate (Ap4A) HIT family hydrolase
VRYRNDKAWPAPVWGAVKAQAYSEVALQSVVNKIREGLGDSFEFTL